MAKINTNCKYTLKKIGDIRPYEKNPRINDDAAPIVAESIRQFGFKVPIVIDKDGIIVAGHTRYKAAKLLKLREVPCIIADDLTPEEIKAFRVADNKVAELSEWDTDLLDVEMVDLVDFQMERFGFDDVEIEAAAPADWFESRERYDNDGLEDETEEYQEFVEKFKSKRTTDDCYTPDNIYEVIADWVANEYGLKRKDFVRPFYPGGDYQSEAYGKNAVVVDNPPFSILSEIIRFYTERSIRYFLFAPAMTCFSNGATQGGAVIIAHTAITYENGAVVPTVFCTNLEPPDIVARTVPELTEKVETVDKENVKAMKRELPKYLYPDQVLTAAIMRRWSKYGVEFTLRREDCSLIDALDAQKESGKSIYGKGYLLSERAAAERAAAERAAAERAAAERAAAERWALSDREWEIVRSLGS